MKRFLFLLFLMPALNLFGDHYSKNDIILGDAVADTTETIEVDSTSFFLAIIENVVDRAYAKDSVSIRSIISQPIISVPQFLKGSVSNIYVQEPTGEPGAYKNMVFRGLGSPLTNNAAINSVQPTVYVNGIPQSLENNFAFDIQKYDFNRIGPATDNLSHYPLSSIESIEVISDPVRLATLGPLAANGAVWITTKAATSGFRKINFGSYYGVATRPQVTTLNATYEDLFRRPFYNRYATLDQSLTYPGYLSDSTNLNFHGPANWNDLYYSNESLYHADLSISGGSERANFGFYGNHTNNAASADNTRFRRYNVLFNVNMIPYEWLKFSAIFNATRSDRTRNTMMRDRFGETEYLPTLNVPLAPNKTVYEQYLVQNQNSVDDNITNAGNMLLSLDVFPMKNLSLRSSFLVDYNEGHRDVFFPSTLLETNNFLSGYFGFNQRMISQNQANYKYDVDERNHLDFTAGFSYQEDLYRYSYARAYDGPSDFVKLNVVEGNPDKAEYLQPEGGLNVFRWSNREDFRLFSSFARVGYDYNNLVQAEALIRYDGASTVQPDSRWLFTPAFSLRWNLKEQFLQENVSINGLYAKLGWARIGKPMLSSRFAAGPQYGSYIGWNSEPNIMSFNGFATSSRPYTAGWVGYAIEWPYTDHLNLELGSNLLDNRLDIAVALYSKKDQNQLTAVPVPLEYGYTGRIVNGLTVENRGVELNVNGQVLANPDRVQWSTGLFANVNRNELLALPNGLNSVLIDGRRLEVGESIDRFWLFQNVGIFDSESQIPVHPQTGRRLNFEGVDFNVGDARWVDTNNDYVINDEDRVLTGRAMPLLTGGWNNTVSYKGLDLSFQFYFAVGHHALNQRAASRYDFINIESKNQVEGIREIFHWQQDVDITRYPLYNPWSSVDPYRVEQDLFLENASYLKLRNVTLGYDFARLQSIQNSFKTIRRAYVYLSGNNLLTVTKFSGVDPELVNFNGYYTGYAIPFTPVYTLGINLEL